MEASGEDQDPIIAQLAAERAHGKGRPFVEKGQPCRPDKDSRVLASRVDREMDRSMPFWLSRPSHSDKTILNPAQISEYQYFFRRISAYALRDWTGE